MAHYWAMAHRLKTSALGQTSFKTIGQVVKKIVPLSENSSSPWCLKVVTGLFFCLRPLCSYRAPEQCTCWPPLSYAPEPVTRAVASGLASGDRPTHLKSVLTSGESRIIFLPKRSGICQYPPKISAINVKKQSRARLLLAHPLLYISKMQKTYGTF